MKKKAQGLADFAAEAALQSRLERERQEAEKRAHAAELRKLVKAENHRQDALRIIRDLAKMAEPPTLRPMPKPSSRAPRHTSALVTSDWQLGQFNERASTGGMYEQTTAITTKQIQKMWSLVEIRHRLESAAKSIEELVIFDLGDLIEGDQMRPSQAGEIDQLITKQALSVYDLEAWLLNQALALFPKVRLLKVGGNHDRTSPKAGNAGLGELGFTDTFSWLVGAILQRTFERSIDAGRLEIQNAESFFDTAVVANQRCVYEHGASFKTSTGSYGGVPYYPIANAARGYKEMLDGADLVLMGHFHRAMVLPMNGGWGWQVVNGALPPSSSWVQSGMKGVGRPTQLMLDLHHEIGLVGWHPLYLETAEQVRPGQYWRKHQKEAA